VAQDTKRAGNLLVQTLIHPDRGQPVQGATLPPRLIVRRILWREMLAVRLAPP